MKKLGVFCLIFVVLAVVLPVMADSVWMPLDDYFMNTWDPASDQTCENVSRRTFMAAGANGYAVAVKTPLDQTPIATYPNGTEFIMDFMCGIGDEKWGTVRSVRYPGQNIFTEDYSGQSGYISQKDLVRAYDTDAFAALNFNSITAYTETFQPCREKAPFVIWSYPYSGVQLSLVSDSVLDWFCYDYESYPDYHPFQADRIYTAPDGTRWLAVHQDKPNTYGWMNMDDPMGGAVIPQY